MCKVQITGNDPAQDIGTILQAIDDEQWFAGDEDRLVLAFIYRLLDHSGSVDDIILVCKDQGIEVEVSDKPKPIKCLTMKPEVLEELKKPVISEFLSKKAEEDGGSDYEFLNGGGQY